MRAALPLLAAMALAATPAGAAPTELAPGITYDRVVAAGPQVTHIVRARPGPLVRVEPVLTGGSPAIRAPLTAAMRARLPGGAVVGINGDYFNFSRAYPSGILVTGGELVSEPEASRSAAVFGADGALLAMRLQLAGRYQAIRPTQVPPPPVRTFTGVNRPFERSGETVVYTPRFGPATPNGSARTEVLVSLDPGATFGPNLQAQGTVAAVLPTTGGTTMAPGQLVIAAEGTAGVALAAEILPGERILVEAGVAGVPPGSPGALGGGPHLVAGGVPIENANEGFTTGQLSQRTSRSAIGQTADGTILLVTVEGPRHGAVGLSVFEQAQLMASLGAVTAVGMDAGGSAGLAIGDRSALTPTSERAITNALVISYLGIRLDPSVTRISPNGDGVDDALVATARVPTAGFVRSALTARDGSREVVLAEGPVSPGPIPLGLDPGARKLKDGPYVLSATLTPGDGSAPSEQRRTIVLDRTLADLKTRPSRVGGIRKVDVSFRLTRPAKVSLRILDANGLVRRIPVNARALRRGRHTLVWDATIGKAQAVGQFQVQVLARTFLGQSELRRAVTLAKLPDVFVIEPVA